MGRAGKTMSPAPGRRPPISEFSIFVLNRHLSPCFQRALPRWGTNPVVSTAAAPGAMSEPDEPDEPSEPRTVALFNPSSRSTINWPVRWIVNEMDTKCASSKAACFCQPWPLAPPAVVRFSCAERKPALPRRYHTDGNQTHRKMRQAQLPCMRKASCSDQCAV